MSSVLVVLKDVQRTNAHGVRSQRHRAGDVEIVRLWGPCPWTAEFSDYDRSNIDLYARLLHDESEGASESHLAYCVFGFSQPTRRTRLVVRSHLNRAHWVADTLFPLLGW
jgi:hypothetical protein